jgi:hypothetical protein
MVEGSYTLLKWGHQALVIMSLASKCFFQRQFFFAQQSHMPIVKETSHEL